MKKKDQKIADELDREKIDNSIVQYLTNTNQPVYRNKLCRDLGIHVNKFTYAIKRVVDRGEVFHHGKQMYASYEKKLDPVTLDRCELSNLWMTKVRVPEGDLRVSFVLLRDG